MLVLTVNVISVRSVRVQCVLKTSWHLWVKDIPYVSSYSKLILRGTLEALHVALDELSTDEVKVRIISSGVELRSLSQM